jgi:HEAT repeat protein
MARVMGKDFAAFAGVSLEHSNEAVRDEALRALRFVGKDAEVSLLQNVAQKSPYPTMKIKALRRLARVEGVDIRTELQSILVDSDAPEDMRVDSVQLLGDIRAEAAKDALQLGLIDPSERIRMAAAVALLKVHMQG